MISVDINHELRSNLWVMKDKGGGGVSREK